MTDEGTHYLILCRNDGVILDTFYIGEPNGYNLDKPLARQALVDEICIEIDLDTDGDEE